VQHGSSSFDFFFSGLDGEQHEDEDDAEDEEVKLVTLSSESTLSVLFFDEQQDERDFAVGGIILSNGMSP
jgi:hypothetical protein